MKALKRGLDRDSSRLQVTDKFLVFFIVLLFFSGFLFVTQFLGWKGLTGFAVFNTSNQTQFEAGNFNQTFFNTSGNGFVMLNLTEGFTSGNFTSEIFDAGALANWTNISWVSSAIGELPNKRRNEVSNGDWGSGVLNMTGNFLLYHFNNDSSQGENNNQVNDTSGMGNNGSVHGNAIANTTSKKLGFSAYTFDGSGDYINHPDFAPAGEFTISAWHYAHDITNAKIFIGDGAAGSGDQKIGFNAENYFIRIINSGSSDNSIPAPPVNTWHHMTLTRDASDKVDLYIDGGPAHRLFSDAAQSGNADFKIIGSASTTAQSYDGELDEVTIWNRSLTSTEVTHLYRRGATKFNLSVRSCNDSACSGETFKAVNTTSPVNLSVIGKNRYFQYRFNFSTENVNYSPELYNVSVETVDSPRIHSPVPSQGSQFNVSTIEIGINTSSDVHTVIANITPPNGTRTRLILSNDGGNKYNHSYNISNFGGLYNVSYYANTSDGSGNNTPSITFEVDFNFTIIKNTSLTKVHPFLGGNKTNVVFNGTFMRLNASSAKNGSFTSQVFSVGSNATFKNISWFTNVDVELPNNQTVDSNFADNNINMTGNVLLFHFNNDSSLGENNSFVIDQSGQSINGSIQGNARVNTTNPKFGQASMTFTGTAGDYIHLGEADLLGGTTGARDFMAGYSEGTVAVWVNNVVNDASFDMYVTKDQQIEFGRASNNQFFVALNNNFFYTGITAPIDWAHVVAVFNGSNRSLYVDGGRQNIGSWTASLNDNSNQIGIGGRPTTAHSMTGELDELAIWNRSLTSGEIRDLYIRGATRLNLTVRSCDDASCSGETFTEINASPEQNLSILNASTHFQYKVNFVTDNISYSPQLHNVTVEYALTDVAAPVLNVSTITSQFNVSEVVELVANVSDKDSSISSVIANVTSANGTRQEFNLSLTSGTKYNASYNISRFGGFYNVSFFADDTNGNANASESVVFEVDFNLTVIKNTSLTKVHPFLGGNKTNVVFNGTFMRLNASSAKNGSFTSQVFSVGSNATFKNISWVSSGYGELPGDRLITTNFVNNNSNVSGNINMTGNVLLYHFNNDTRFGESATNVFDFSGMGNNGTHESGAVNDLVTKKLGEASISLSSSIVDVIDSVGGGHPFTTMGNSNNYAVMAWIKTSAAVSDDEDFWFPEDTIIELRTQTSTGTKVPFSFGLEDGTIVLGRTTDHITTDEREIASTTVNDGQWHLVGFVEETDDVYFYIDGVLDASSTFTTATGDTSVAGTTANMQIGARSRNGGEKDVNYFVGNIDEITIWNRSLSGGEVRDLYLRGATRLNLTVRSCDDSSCSGETFTEINESPEQNLSILNASTFFQYKVNFVTDNISYSPELYNVTVEFIGDNLAPTVTTLIPSNNSVFNVSNVFEVAANVADNTGVNTVKANVTYPNSTINQLTLSLSSGSKYNTSFTLPALLGKYNITFIATDTGNNENASEKSNFTVEDNKNATLVGFVPANNSLFNVTNVIEVAVNASDDVGVSEVRVNITSPNSTITQLNLSLATGTKYNTSFRIHKVVGKYNITFIVNDTSNNINASEKSNFTANDVSAPNVFGLIPANASTFNETEVMEIAANVTDNIGVNSVSANVTRIDQIVEQINLSLVAGNKYNASYDIPKLSGNYNITFFADDDTGNLNGTEMVNITIINGIHPNVTNASPQVNTVFNVSDVFEIGVNVTDDAAVFNVRANVTRPNGTLTEHVLSLAETNRYNTSFTAPALLGDYNITFFANDTGGNVNTSVSTNFTVEDNKNATLVGFVPANNSLFNVTNVIEVAVNASDDVGVSEVRVNITSPNSTITQLNLSLVTGTKYNTSFRIHNVVGKYNITFIVNDSSNHVNASEKTNFTVNDVKAPLISNENVTNTALSSGETAVFNATVTDATSSLDTVLVTINNTDGTLTNITMSNIAGTDFYNGSFIVGKSGKWFMKVFANDTRGNLNNTRSFLSFNVSVPNATAQNELFPDLALSLSVIRIVGELTTTDVLHEVNATLNLPTNFTFLAGYNQTQNVSNFTIGQSKNVTWYVGVPQPAGNYTFNITYNDLYLNTFNSSNYNITVNNSLASPLSATFVNVINFIEVEAGNAYTAEISVKDQNGNFVNSDGLPRISIFDPLGDLNTGPTTTGVSNISTGRYNYTKTTASTDTSGQWQTLANVTRGGNFYLDREFFELTAGPFDVRDIILEDLTAPDLKISVVLENTGGNPADMRVVWVLTREDTGGIIESDVMLVPVEGKSEKLVTITPTTSYVGKAKISFEGTYGTPTERAGAFETFMIKSEGSSTVQEVQEQEVKEEAQDQVTPKAIAEQEQHTVDSLQTLTDLFAKLLLVKENLRKSSLNVTAELERMQTLDGEAQRILDLQNSPGEAKRLLSATTTSMAVLEQDMKDKGLFASEFSISIPYKIIAWIFLVIVGCGGMFMVITSLRDSWESKKYNKSPPQEVKSRVDTLSSDLAVIQKEKEETQARIREMQKRLKRGK
jgi:hypothetical protein